MPIRVKVNKFQFALLISLVAMLCPPLLLAAQSEGQADEQNSKVLQAFVSKEKKTSDIVTVDDKTKRIVMFSMGVPLLILLLATAALGVAMGVYGKPVFLAHLICAALSLTLAMAHAVAGIVWFYPF